MADLIEGADGQWYVTDDEASMYTPDKADEAAREFMLRASEARRINAGELPPPCSTCGGLIQGGQPPDFCWRTDRPNYPARFDHPCAAGLGQP